MADLSFYYALDTGNRINYDSALENIVYLYAGSLGYVTSVGRIGRLECDFYTSKFWIGLILEGK